VATNKMSAAAAAAGPDGLFDADLQAWYANPERAFDGWLARRPVLAQAAE